MILHYAYRVSLLALAAHAVLADQANADKYANYVMSGIRALNDHWYNVETGIWDDAWWNSGNALTVLADFAAIRLDDANELNVGGYMRNTYIAAQKINVKTAKFVSKAGMVSSVYCLDRNSGCMAKREFLGKRGFDDFINDFYDDEGWWALGWIRSYDVSGEFNYLKTAIDLFNDMKTGTNTSCGGGIYWSKKRDYVNAIANELYLSVAAALARRIPEDPTYLDIAKEQWAWFEQSGMINQQNLINDGLDKSCKNPGFQTWTYNQGVVLGGLADLFYITNDLKYVEKAVSIAQAAIKALSVNGILTEVDGCEARGACGRDGSQFKGIFIRNLRYLHNVAPKQEFKDFIIRNADSIWENDRSNDDRFGVAWTGPYFEAFGATQSSALDALVAAVAVA